MIIWNNVEPKVSSWWVFGQVGYLMQRFIDVLVCTLFAIFGASYDIKLQ